MTIKTTSEWPPITTRDFDWSAVDLDTFDADYDYQLGAYISQCPIGRGPTELDAIFDLLEQIEARA